MREICTKEISFVYLWWCMRKLQTKIRHRSSIENNRKFNYYSGWILDEKLLKLPRVWKNDQHGKVACLQQLSNGMSFAQFRWVDEELRVVDGELRAKKSREKQSEVQVHSPRSSGSSRGAFSKNLFRDKGRTNDLAIFEITWKRLGIRENYEHEKVLHFA